MKYIIMMLLAAALACGGINSVPAAFADQHGKHHMMGHHGSSHHWKATLSDEQIKEINKLKLDYKKKKYPVKAKLKQAKVELALLMTADSPKQKDIDKKIDQILKLKGEKMRLKTGFKISMRKVLNDEQRVMFDMHLLKKAYHGKKHKRRHHH
jgi:Spy/CpxP family protein refolding chaperone